MYDSLPNLILSGALNGTIHRDKVPPTKKTKIVEQKKHIFSHFEEIYLNNVVTNRFAVRKIQARIRYDFEF